MPETNVTGAIAERPIMLRGEADSGAMLRRAVLVFACADNAERLVAGVPAVARAVREAALAGMDECLIATEGDWRPGPAVAAEIERLACGMQVTPATTRGAQLAVALGCAVAASGEQLCGAGHGQAAQMLRRHRGPLALTNATGDCFTAKADLNLAERRIMLATAKATDGLVARTLNRPISRQLSGLLLRFSSVRPFHATMVTAAVAVVMLACLLAGGSPGLLAGAILFQAASILDGVDGEIARATFRASPSGAMLDSLVDMATNVAFIGGVVANLWAAGAGEVAALGAGGLACMSLGLLLLGMESRRGKGPLTFDLLKDHFGRRPSPWRKGLTWLTMRDFYAFAGFLFVATGYAGAGLVAFAVIAGGWLAAVCAALARRAVARRGIQGSGSQGMKGDEDAQANSRRHGTGDAVGHFGRLGRPARGGPDTGQPAG